MKSQTFSNKVQGTLGKRVTESSRHNLLASDLPMPQPQSLAFLATCHVCWLLYQTSLTLAWAVYLLARHRDVQQTVYQEIVKNLGERQVPTAADVSKVPLIQVLLKENLKEKSHGNSCPDRDSDSLL